MEHEQAATRPKPRRRTIIAGLAVLAAVAGAVVLLRQPVEPDTTAAAVRQPVIAVHPGPSSDPWIREAQAQIDRTRWDASILGLGLRGVGITVVAGNSTASANVIGLGPTEASGRAGRCVDLVNKHSTDGGPGQPAITVTVTRDSTAEIKIRWPDGRTSVITEHLATCLTPAEAPPGPASDATEPGRSATPVPPTSAPSTSASQVPSDSDRPASG